MIANFLAILCIALGASGTVFAAESSTLAAPCDRQLDPGLVPRRGNPPTQRFAVGDLVDSRWKLLSEIATGGSGTFFRGVNIQTGQAVGIKIAKYTGAATDLSARNMIANELRIKGSLNRPVDELLGQNVVPPLEGKAKNYLAYVVYPWIDHARSVADFLTGREHLTASQVYALIEALLDPVDVLHGKKIVHCDLKPANFLIDAQSKVYLIDLGLSVDLSLPLPEFELAGSDGFMAPEQMFEDEWHNLAPATDVFALGRIIGAIVAMAGNGLDNALQRDLESIAQKAESYRIEDRFGSVRELREAVLAVKKNRMLPK